MAVIGRFFPQRTAQLLLRWASFCIVAAYPSFVLAPVPPFFPSGKTGRLVASDRSTVAVPGRLMVSSRHDVVIDGFRREWRVSGPALCEALGQSGLSMTKWRAASLRSASYECNFLRIFDRDGFRPIKSMFLRVSGNARGDISSIRGMVLIPNDQPDADIRDGATRILETIIAQTEWLDMRILLPRMIELEKVDYDQFGTRFHFGQDADSDAGLRFAFSLEVGLRPQVSNATAFRIR